VSSPSQYLRRADRQVARRFLVALAGLLVAAALMIGACSGVAQAQGARSATTTLRAQTALAQLRTAGPHHRGFSVRQFPQWTDDDHDGCNTRNEVLIAEAAVKPRVSRSCTLAGGSWVSQYDHATIAKAGQVHVDFTVPLAEAWASGAYRWSRTTRQRFANDLGLGRTLIGVSGAARTAKGDSSPMGYLPPRKSYDCTYVVSWVAVKWRWQLSVDSAERAFLQRFLRGCGARTVAEPSRPVLGWSVARLPLRHSGAHPGAAVLAGDAPLVPAAAVPSNATRAGDAMSTPDCLIAFSVNAPHYCSLGDTHHPLLTIALVGDSMAQQWDAALQEIALVHHWRIEMIVKAACQWTATMTMHWGTTTPYTSCHTWGQLVLNHLLGTLKPDVVIVGDRPMNGTLTLPPGSAANTTIGHGMATYWRSLLDRHIAVVGLKETPETGATKGSPTPLPTPRGKALRRITPITVAAGLVHAAHLVNLSSDICGPATCHPVEGNVTVYRDSHHMTQTYIRTLAPYLERKLLQIPVFATA
jgi:SGNH domain (fused to AT3 domains)